jgi:parallel beta-helix repeat protein
MKKYALFVTIALFVSLFIVSGASAVIRFVNATPVLGCPSYATIQAAVDASVATDTIVVHPGVYYENVVVTGKNNIAIQGGKVVVISGRLSVQATMPEQAVVDARPVFDTCTGPGFYIDAADNISIRNLTVRFACADGINGDNIYSTGNFTFIDKVFSLSAEDSGIEISGNRTTVQNSFIFGNGNYDYSAVLISGDYATVQVNTIWNNDGRGIEVQGLNPLITKNDLKQIEDHACIYVNTGSDNALVTYNKIQGCDTEGIYVTGSYKPNVSNNDIKDIAGDGIHINALNEAAVKSNTIAGVYGAGIYIENSNISVVDKNAITATYYEGIYVYTDNGSGGNTISNNTTEYSDYEGIYVQDNNPTVTGNTVRNIYDDDGFEIKCYSTCTGGQISNNKAMNNGEDYNGFDLTVDNMIISNNTAEHIFSTCFDIEGDNNTIQYNNARWCGAEGPTEAGIYVNGDNNLIKGNLAEFNQGRGISVHGNNIVTLNTSRKNYWTGLYLQSGNTAVLNVTYNTVTDNHGEGIANFAPGGGGGTVNISNNTVLRNRTDICNESIITTFTSNIFTTGGTGTLCDLE